MSFEKTLKLWTTEISTYHERTQAASSRLTKLIGKMSSADAKKAINQWEVFARRSETKLQKRLAEVDDLVAEKEITTNFKKRKVRIIETSQTFIVN